MDKYQDHEVLEQAKTIWLTREVHTLLQKEKDRLQKTEGRRVSIAKIVNNLIAREYGLPEE